uniref:Ion transport domain-containing protein n=1 Tax=Aureoumbra lagunensis TaxID=44058 RepID=A0A7S3JYQ2_9STRA
MSEYESIPRPSSLRRSVSGLRKSDKFDKTASLISDALAGIVQPQPKEGPFATCCFHVHLWIHVVIKAIIVPGFLVLSFFERPFWCSIENAKECECIWNPMEPDVCTIPTFDIKYLGEKPRLYIEITLLGIVIVHQLLLRIAMGGKNYFAAHGCTEGLAIFLLSASLILLQTDQKYHYLDFYTLLGNRIALWLPLFRLFVFVAYSDDVRSQIFLVIRIIPHYLRVGALLALLTIFYAWFGVVVFPTIDQQSDYLKKNQTYDTLSEGDMYFPNLREGMWSLLVLVSTANFPDVALPAYAINRWSMLFFISYLLIGCFFMMNLLLATVYNVYVEEGKKAQEQANKNADINLRKAFTLLSDDHDYINTTSIRGVFAELNQHQEVLYIDDERSEELLAALDKTIESKIDYDAFKKLCLMIQLEPSIKNFDAEDTNRLADILNSDAFEYFIDFLILLNAAVVAAQTRDEIMGYHNRSAEEAEGPIWECIETVLAVFYFIEMCLKIYAFGLKRYFHFCRNQFDAFVSIASVITTFVVYWPNAYNDPSFVRYVLMLRLIRLVRILEAITDFRILGESFLNLLPAAAKLLKFLFCVTYLFAVLGMAIFGGNLSDKPSQRTLLKDTDFYTSGYLPLNFNDMWSSYVTLFCILVVNNWQVLTQGFVAIAGVNARLFFIAFYSVGTLICVNLAVAFIIDTFTVEQEKTKEKASKRTAMRHASSIRRRNPNAAVQNDEEAIALNRA